MEQVLTMLSLNFWQTFRIYFTYSLEFLIIPENVGVTISLVVNLLASILYSWHSRKQNWHARHSWAFAQFLFLPVLLAIAVVGTYTDPMNRTVARPAPEVWVLWTVDALMIGALILGLYFAYRMRGLRWFAVSLLLIQVWLMRGAHLVASMAINGDWI